MKSRVIILFLILITACSSKRGVDCNALRAQITGQPIVTDEPIKSDLAPKLQLPSPYKLGIYFYPPKFAYRCGGSLSWLDEDRNRVVEIAAELKRKNIISDFFVIKDFALEGNDKQALRMAAIAGADAALIVRGVVDIDKYHNLLGYTYLLLLTPFFVPGTEADGVFIANANLWDVRNESLYLSAEGEGEAKEVRPAAFIDEGEIIKEAKGHAMAALKERLDVQWGNIETK